MSKRLALRLLSGTKEGTTVPVPDAGLTVGRRAGNDLVLDDASVSGQHAKLTLEKGDLWVADVGSTNGTKVGGRKVERMSLLPGDELVFGSVRAQVVEVEAPANAPAAPVSTGSFLDDVDEISLEEPAPSAIPARAAAPAPAARPAPERSTAPAARAPAARAASAPPTEIALPEDDEPLRADLSALERSSGGSKVVAFAIGAVVLIGGAAGAWLAFGGGSGGGDASGGPAVALAPIEGNLLGADWSFEEDESASSWTSSELAPGVFTRGRNGALSGRSGLSGSFASAPDASDWALEESAPVRVQPGRVIEASVAALVEGAAFARVGIAFVAEDGTTPVGAPLFGPRVETSDGERIVCSAPAPSGAASARVVLVGGGDGDVTFDDAALVVASAARGPGAIGEFTATTTGDGEGTLVLTRLDVPIVTLRGERADAPHASGAALTVGAVAGAPRLDVAVAGSAPRTLHVDSPSTDAGPRPIAYVADGRYSATSGDFEASGVTQLLAGRGLELVRFEFEAPVTLRRRVDASGSRLEIDLASNTKVALQLAFGSERDAAVTLAAANRRAERDEKLGDALAGWSKLLANFGFEETLVAESETAIARLSAIGGAELEAISRDVERADFFGLDGIYAECAARAEALRARFEPTDTAGATGGAAANAIVAAADALAVRIEASRAELAGRATSERVQASAAIAAYLERQGLVRLAERLARD
jgi:pSer/pThr/pTyr-binding forkhead associated (FHA) protein